MSSFSLDAFARQLLIEALFFDPEYGALGNISLIDTENAREGFLASYDPERETYLIEKAVEWEDAESADPDTDLDYALAVDGEEYGSYETPEAAADELLSLAQTHNLRPSFMILFEDSDL